MDDTNVALIAVGATLLGVLVGAVIQVIVPFLSLSINKDERRNQRREAYDRFVWKKCYKAATALMAYAMHPQAAWSIRLNRPDVFVQEYVLTFSTLDSRPVAFHNKAMSEGWAALSKIAIPLRERLDKGDQLTQPELIALAEALNTLQKLALNQMDMVMPDVL